MAIGFGNTGFGDVIIESDFPADLLDLLTSVVGIYSRLSVDGYGKPTYGSAVNYQCRISERAVKVRDAQGEEIVADGSVLLGGHPVIPPDSKITLPDSSTPVMIAINRAYDENGPHHTRIFFSKKGG